MTHENISVPKKIIHFLILFSRYNTWNAASTSPPTTSAAFFDVRSTSTTTRNHGYDWFRQFQFVRFKQAQVYSTPWDRCLILSCKPRYEYIVLTPPCLYHPSALFVWNSAFKRHQQPFFFFFFFTFYHIRTPQK